MMGGQTPEDYSVVSPPEESIGDIATRLALEAIRGGARQRTEAGPTPEDRGVVVPLVQPKGSSQVELGVPGFLHEPYRAFEEMYDLLDRGVPVDDPRIIALSAKLSVSILGMGAGLAVTSEAAGVVKGGIAKAAGAVGELRNLHPDLGIPPDTVVAASKPAQTKSKNIPPPAEVPRELDESGFYSHLHETVAKLEKSEAHPTEYMALLEPGRSGVKENEIRATDLDRHLLGDETADLRRAIIDGKDAISDSVKWAKELETKISETTNSHDREVYTRDLEVLKAQTENAKTQGRHAVAIYSDKIKGLRQEDTRYTRSQVSDYVKQNKTIVEEIRYTKNPTYDENTAGGDYDTITQYSRYSTDPANPTMREVQLTIRNPEAEARLEAIDERLKILDNPKNEGHPNEDKMIEEMQQLRAKKANIQDSAYYSRGHFTQNTAAWYMASIQPGKDGRKAFTVHQVQSDWGQEARSGVRNPAEIKRLEEAIKTASNEAEDIKNKGMFRPGRHIDRDKALEFAMNIGHIASLTQSEISSLRLAIIRSNNPGFWEDSLQAGLTDIAAPEVAASLRQKIANSEPARRELMILREDYRKYYVKSILERELLDAKYNPIGHPMISSTTQWVDLAVKRIIKDAVDSGADTIAIPHGKTVKSYTGGQEEGQGKFYEVILPKRIEKALKDMDPSVEKFDNVKDLRTHDDKPLKHEELGSHSRTRNVPARFTEFSLTDAVREKSKKGFKLYSRGPAMIPPQDEENK